MCRERVARANALPEPRLSISAPTILKGIYEMEKLGIINEITGKKRNRVWVYSSYWQILNDNT